MAYLNSGDPGPSGSGDVLTLRRAELTDLDTIVAYNRAMCKETEGYDLDAPTITAGVRAVLDGCASSAATYYVAEEGGDVIAQAMITLEWSDWRNCQVWWIQSVYVRPECRRRGVFSRLYAHLRRLAHAAGAAGLRLYAETNNVRAHATYEKLGMVSTYKVFSDMFTDH